MKIWVISKKHGMMLAAVVLVLSAFIILGNHQITSVSKTQKDLPIYCVDKGDEKILSISFDAAWGNEDTQTLIDILGKYNVKATFFVVGGWVDKYPESVKALSDAGHEIMNHSNTHPHMTQISKEKMAEELNTCNDKIEKVTGVRPTLFRAPYGDYNDSVVQTMRENGCFTIQWDVDSLDWKDLASTEIFDRVTKKVKPGSIVLFHNAAKHTPEALPSIIEKLQSDGYKFVPISELIIKENYAIDPSGKQYAQNNSNEENTNDRMNENNNENNNENENN